MSAAAIPRLIFTAAGLLALLWQTLCPAMDITDKLSFNGVLAGGYQYQQLNDIPGFIDTGRGAVPFQPEISYRPTARDEIHFKFGFAAGNGLNDGTSPFAVPPWGADLQDDVRNINGRNRDYLLTAWYQHDFALGADQSLALTGGLIDTTDYLGGNAYASDEYNQFMNAALVNAPNALYPSYDIGGVAEWTIDRFTFTGLVMQVGRNDDGLSYLYYGFQVGATVETRLGEGHYRLTLNSTSKDFPEPSGTDLASVRGGILSFDQQLGQILGAWIRLGWQTDNAAVDFANLYSGGVNIEGSLWNRAGDNIGIGYALLNGGNQNIDSYQVLEAYLRLALTDIFAVTFDLQSLKEKVETGVSPAGLIYGLRLTAEF